MNSSFADVLLVPFPFTNQAAVKKRPAVVVSSAPYNDTHGDVIVMAVTSRITSPLGFGEIVINEWQAAGLLKPSCLKPCLVTIEQCLVLRKLGRLQREDIESLKQVLALILD